MAYYLLYFNLEVANITNTAKVNKAQAASKSKPEVAKPDKIANVNTSTKPTAPIM